MTHKRIKGECRTPEQIREHYEIEKLLADRLRHACREERRCLYASLYNELYRRVPLHPQLIRKASPQETERAISVKLKFLKRSCARRVRFWKLDLAIVPSLSQWPLL